MKFDQIQHPHEQKTQLESKKTLYVNQNNTIRQLW